MRRILAILLVCLLPLQSFAGAGMAVKMASMDLAMSQMEMAGSVQAPCHMASQVELPASQDCCGSQAMCQSLCQIFTALPMSMGVLNAVTPPILVLPFVASFQSAVLGAGFKPPIL